MIARCKLPSILIHCILALAVCVVAVNSRQPHVEQNGNGGTGGGGRSERGREAGGKNGMGRHRGNKYHQGENDLALWINEQQVKILSGNIVVHSFSLISIENYMELKYWNTMVHPNQDSR